MNQEFLQTIFHVRAFNGGKAQRLQTASALSTSNECTPGKVSEALVLSQSKAGGR